MQINNHDMTFKCSDDTQMIAFLSRPEGQGARPAIIVIHEAYGLNDQIKGVARRFAAEGFVVIAPHLFTRNGEVMTEKN